MPNVRHPLDTDDLVRLYAAGVTGQQLAQRLGVGKSTIYRRLTEAGVALRRERHHVARSAATASFDELCHRAATRELNVTQDSALERTVAEALMERGAGEPVRQKAIGPYNADLFLEPVAVEVWGGGWHGSGDHAQRFEQRTRHILDAGWHQLVVRVQSNVPFTRRAADQVVALLNFARTHPTAPRQNWMIWGNGKRVIRGYQTDDLPVVVAD